MKNLFSKPRSLIVGYGEIGRAIHDVIGEAELLDTAKDLKPESGPYDIMHICFPWNDDFIQHVERYRNDYHAENVIIYSTVMIGTTRQIDRAVHSPIEGRHPELAQSIKLMTRWIGGLRPNDTSYFKDYFGEIGLRVREVNNPDWTEALKLLSTSEYGINLVFADYKQRVAEELGMSSGALKQWNKDYNTLYKQLDMPQFQKYILDSPNGTIGGHCVVPNAKLLNEQYSSELLTLIEGME